MPNTLTKPVKADYRVIIRNAKTGLSQTASVVGDGVALFRKIGEIIDCAAWKSTRDDPTVKVKQ